MDYKPPRALEVLITPEILSKYQRMFAFILRLMRGNDSVWLFLLALNFLQLRTLSKLCIE